MLALHALLAIGFLSGGTALVLAPPPLRSVPSKLLEARTDPHSGGGGFGLRPRHPLTHDTCLYANATTLSDMTFSGLSSTSSSSAFTDLDTCLCLSGLSATLEAMSSTASLVDEYGLTDVEQAFGAYIASSSFAKMCSYPPNATPMCTRDDVCSFSCNPPFVAVGDSCVCQDASACGPPTPPATCQTPGKTRHHSKRSTTSTLAMAQSACETDETVCGAFGGATASFECVNIQTSLDSCGGCMMPNPFGLRVNERAPGVDCTAIPSVDAVSCMAGRCVVQSCLSGWTVDAEGTGCIQEQPAEDAPALFEQSLRRDLALQSHPTESSDHNMKPQSDYVWRVPDIRSEAVHEGRDVGAAPMQFKEDWARIPDIRRRV